MKTEKKVEPSENEWTEICAVCGKPYTENRFGALFRVIMKHKPACSYECNKKLGQAD